MKQYLLLRFAFSVWVTSLLVTALAGIELQAQTQTATRPSQIVITTTPSSGAVTVQLTIPADVQLDTLSMKLNGNDLSRKFTTVSCPQGVCQQATFTSPDGLHDSKNAFSVIAKRNNGTFVSTRSRFVGTTATAAARVATVNPQAVHANALSGFPTLSSFLPPAIAFTTLKPGGYDNAHAWIQVGSQNTYPANPSSQPCSNIYTVIVLDRQTLEEKTTAPESSPQCISNGGQLKTYLSTLNSGDLVIVGTNSGQNSDALSGNGQLDTSAIGGTAYNCLDSTDCSSLPSTTVQSVDAPQTYMIIGVGGAASGSAYENYNIINGVWYQINAYGTGTLVEDSNGNYNFQPANSIEYTIVPNDPNNSNVSTVSVGPLPGDPYASAGIVTKTYRPPYNPSTPNGIWLLKLQRTTLFSTAFNVQGTPPAPSYQDACTGSSSDGKTAYFNQCGQFYDTGDSDPKTAIAAYNQLGTDLQEIDTNDLIFLVSIGNQPNSPGLNFTIVPSGFATAFSAIGGTPETFTGLNKPGSTYSYIGCVRCGNSLGGNVVVSTNLQSQQGQNGYIHGLLQPNLNGLYWPTQASLDQPGSDGLPTTDFTIQEVTTTQPVDWPELSATQKLTSTTSSGTTYTADTTDGQNAAYYYISYQLVTQYYILGAQGNYLDDIHYYFTGGNNTFLDYHTFDPANLPFPGSSPTGCYQWADPVPSRGTLACFTQNDFNAVRAQMHNEIVYLTNVLQFMVNGSTNMKDLVASGNGSAALALINAAATVQASTLQPPPATPVKFNVSNILNLVGNAVSLAASVATGGLTADGTELAAKAASGLGPSAGVISAIFGASSAVTGGLLTPGSAPVPGNNANFLTTIGNLSQSELQQNFTAGFDASLDTILGDWYKLSTIGPQITNTNVNAFQSPTQNSQVVATRQIGLGAQRSFYLALLPIDYSIQHYTYWWGTPDAPNNPDMGARTQADPGNCNTWYYSAPAPSTINLVSKSYLSYSDEGPTNFAFWYQDTTPVTIPSPLDWFVIASSATPAKAGTGSQQIQLLDSQVASTLFSASQLNIPMDPFLDQGGPMASVWWDSATVGFDHFPANQTCSLYVAGKYGNSLPSTGTLTGSQSNPVQVTLEIPTSGVLGDNVALKAVAVVANAPVTSGMIAFSDGGAEIGRSALDSTGTATLTTNTLALGPHTISASFVATTQYTATNPVTASLTIYANDADLTLSPSTASLSVTSGSSSSPLNLQVTSKWGLAGPVAFSCSGLPAGTMCNFAPAQVTLTGGTSATTSLTITRVNQTAKLGSTTGVFAAMLLPLPILLLRRRYRSIQLLCAIVIVSAGSLGLLTGCSSGSSAPATQPTASTVLVTATSGTVSRSIPINVTVQ